MQHGILKALTNKKNIAIAFGLLVVGSWMAKNSRWSGPDIEDFKQNKTEVITERPADAPIAKTTYDATQDFQDNQKDVTDLGGTEPELPTLNSEQILRKVQSVDKDPLMRDRNFYSLIFLRTQLLPNDHLGSTDIKTLNTVFDDTRNLEKLEQNGGDARSQFKEKFYEHLIKLEGKKGLSYTDSEGYKTIGIGFNMEKPDARYVWTKAFGKEVKKDGKVQIVDQVDFDDAFYGRVKLDNNQIDRLYEAGMYGYVTVYQDDNIYDGVVPDKSAKAKTKGYDGKKVTKRFPGYYEQLKNYVRPNAMEDVPYNVQFAVLSIIYQTPGTLSKNMDEVKDIVGVFCDENASNEKKIQAGSRMADIYEETLSENTGATSPNLKGTRWLEKYHLLCGQTEGAYPVKGDRLMSRLQERLVVHGNSKKHTKVIIGGHLPDNFSPDNLKDLDNKGKTLTIYAPEDDTIIRMEKDKTLRVGSFASPPFVTKTARASSSPSSS